MDRSLSKAAQQRITRIGSRSPLPPWFQAFSTLLLIVFAGYVAIQIMIGSPTPSKQSTPTTVATSPASSTPTTSLPVTTTTTTNGATVAVENAQQDGSVNIAAGAVNLVKRIAIAEVTGKTTGIPRAPGSSPVPGAAVPYASAALQSLEVNTGGTGATSFSFLANVSTGPNGTVGTFSISVVLDKGSWKYTSSP
jgi:hypothetical protein